MVHLPRGQTGEGESVDMKDLGRKIERLEGDWGALVNEFLYHQTSRWTEEDPDLGPVTEAPEG